jgi:hypothetical protein
MLCWLGLVIVMNWTWISSHGLRFLYPTGLVAIVDSSGSLAVPLQHTHLVDRGQSLPRNGLARLRVRYNRCSLPAQHRLPHTRARGRELSKPFEPLGGAKVARSDVTA